MSFYSGSGSFYSGSQNYITAFNENYVAAPVFLFDYVSYGGAALVARGKVPLISWLFNTSPFINMSIISMNGKLQIAKGVAVGSSMGQVLIELGDI